MKNGKVQIKTIIRPSVGGRSNKEGWLKEKLKSLMLRIMGKMMEKMIIGKDFEELSISAERIAKRETDEEFKRRWRTEGRGRDYDTWFFEQNVRVRYNEMLKLSYQKWIGELKKAWYFTHLDKLISEKK